ncbi:hypothetical protein [Yinghuangia soli]|uniref:Uncharacterized protein n=1 Tax=Yinghuangia soli TaxID=2908204 RepID=A0AA41PWX8_9ACTN|nr:hypothetical protein [Yinghuangia soli]MCF2527238.1 hypothetical protein [Yinghuangia soli]
MYTRCTCGSIAVRLLPPRPVADAGLLAQSRAPEPVMDLLAGAGGTARAAGARFGTQAPETAG